MTKYIYLLPLCLMMLTLSSQQSPLTKENDAIKVTSFGENTSLLELLLSIEDASYQTTAEETLKTIASKYYGYSAFSALIKASNPRLSEDATLPVDSQVNLPSVVLCVHFLTVDCVKDSFDFIQSFPDSGVLINGVLSNYWTQISENIKNKFTTSTFLYPNYINFIMGYINNLPKSDLKVQITNNLPYDLTEGAVSFDFGVGGSPASVISTKTSYSYSAQRSNDLKNIQGQLSYKIADGANSVNGISFNFNIYPGDSTDTRLPNYVKIQSGESTWFQYQGDILGRFSVSSDSEVLITVSKNPSHFINIIFNSRLDLTAKFSTVNQPYYISSLSKWGLSLQTLTTSGYTRLVQGLRVSPNSFNWLFVPVEDQKSQFRVINPDNLNCIEANSAHSNLTFAPTAANERQIWDLIPVENSVIPYEDHTYMIKGQNNLCWELIPSTSFPGSIANYQNPVILEPCNFNTDYQKWYIRSSDNLGPFNSASGYKFIITRSNMKWTIDMWNASNPYFWPSEPLNTNQKFTIAQNPEGYQIKFLSNNTNDCWSLTTTTPRRLTGISCTSTDRFWRIEPLGSGVSLTHITSGLSLQGRATPSNGARVEAGELNGDESIYAWKIEVWA